MGERSGGVRSLRVPGGPSSRREIHLVSAGSRQHWRLLRPPKYQFPSIGGQLPASGGICAAWYLVLEEALPVSGPWGAPLCCRNPTRRWRAAMMQRDAAVEYERSLRLWRHYLTTDDFTEVMFAELMDANQSLVKALLGQPAPGGSVSAHNRRRVCSNGKPDAFRTSWQKSCRLWPGQGRSGRKQKGKTTDTVVALPVQEESISFSRLASPGHCCGKAEPRFPAELRLPGMSG